MNFLAHLTLSHFSADLQVGNFVGDFVRGRELAQLPEPVQRGVRFHRAIDALTDRDPDVRQLNKLLTTRHGRYAPVVSDIAFDYFLYRNWSLYGPEPFALFRDRTYARLLRSRPQLSGRLNGYLDGMVSGDWLQLYTSRDGMDRVFERLLGRLSRPEMLTGVSDTLDNYAGHFNLTLHRLFPRLQQLSDTYRDHPRSA